MRNLSLIRFVFVLILLSATEFSIAQTDQTKLQPVTRAFALTNATVVQAPDRTVTNTTVVVRNGLIVSVGKNIDIPLDAQIVRADSLYVYAGFIDGLSQAGVEKPGGNQRGTDTSRFSARSKYNPADPPNAVAGIQPDAEVRQFLNPDLKSVEELRKIGFTASHVVPYGKMLTGSGALVLMGGDSPDAMMLRDDMSLFSQFQGADRLYPATVLGMMAKWRDLYRQAEISKAYETKFSENPSGLERPVYDRVIAAFYPVIDGNKIVYFKTPSVLDAYRAFTLQSDLSFPLVLAGLKQGWDLIDKLKSTNTRVFLSLDLPEDAKTKKNEAAEADSTKTTKNEKEEAPTFMTETEKKALEARQDAFRKKYETQPQMLQEAGIAFGFSTLEADTKDIRKNLQRMVKSGLSEAAALTALTTAPAAIMGVSDMLGTVDAGKIANMVVTTKPYFEEDSSIKYVFVDGKMYEYEVTEKKTDKKETDTSGK